MIDLKKQKLLIIAPHPDDEIIGCGGLIQRIKKSGGKVYVLFLTVGLTRDFSKKGVSSSIQRKKEIEKVASFLKYDKYSIALEGDDYHLHLDLVGQKKLMDIIERDSELAIEKLHPTIVAFPSIVSYNQDHRIAAYATHAALRPSEKTLKHFIPTVLTYEEVADSWTMEATISPNVFIQLTKKEMQTKLDALKLYRSQLRKSPNLRSSDALFALAGLRGKEISADFAESFVNYRISL